MRKQISKQLTAFVINSKNEGENTYIVAKTFNNKILHIVAPITQINRGNMIKAIGFFTKNHGFKANSLQKTA